MTQPLLLDAADYFRRDGEPENRLTEIVAAVLRASPRLVAWLSAEAWSQDDDVALGWVAGGYDVSTQVSLSGGGRPDMCITFRSKGPPGPVYCENKIGAGPTQWQAKGYPGVGDAGGRLIVLSPQGWNLPGGSVALRWQDLADQVQQIGQDWVLSDPSNWHARAVRPDAPSEYRMLLELLRYLVRAARSPGD